MTQQSNLTGLLNFSIRKQAEQKEKDEVFRTALELLDRRISTMQIQIQEGRGDYSEADLDDYTESCLFLNKYYGKDYKTNI